jgi:hypothetical protein
MQGEKMVFEAIVGGATPLDEFLRQQVEARGFVLEFQTSLDGDRMRVTLVYDGRLAPAVRVPTQETLVLNDVELRFEELDDWVSARAIVHEGILSIVELTRPSTVRRWPKRLTVCAWRYRSGGPQQERIGFHPGDPGSAPEWLEHALRHGGMTGVAAGPGALPADLETLPTMLAELLGWSNGANLWGAEILSATQVYSVDWKGEPLLVFSTTASGNFSALKSSGEVVYVDLESDTLVEIAPDLTYWVAFLSDEAARRQR